MDGNDNYGICSFYYGIKVVFYERRCYRISTECEICLKKQKEVLPKSRYEVVDYTKVEVNQ